MLEFFDDSSLYFVQDKGSGSSSLVISILYTHVFLVIKLYTKINIPDPIPRKFQRAEERSSLRYSLSQKNTYPFMATHTASCVYNTIYIHFQKQG